MRTRGAGQLRSALILSAALFFVLSNLASFRRTPSELINAFRHVSIPFKLDDMSSQMTTSGSAPSRSLGTRGRRILDSDAIIGRSAVNYVVWTFPFPPPPRQQQEYDESSTTSSIIHICHYANACRDDTSSVFHQINLRSLTEGTYFDNYVRDHAYHKIRHKEQFLLHIQAITMLSILRLSPGSCVKTWGATTTRQFCDANEFSSYDPYQLDLNATSYPFVFLQGDDEDGASSQPSTLLSLVPDLGQERFGMWGYDYGNDPWVKEYPRGRFNSGEDVQSFASVTWYPFLTDVVNKEKALATFDGHYIANALVGALDTPEKSTIQEDRIKRESLISIYMPSVKKNAAYFKAYTDVVGEAFGARSTKTQRELLSLGIKSYFSACLTLTVGMQGAQLDPNTPKCNSLLCHDLVFPKPPNSTASERHATTQETTPTDKSLIVMVDVIDRSAVPRQVERRALKFTADIPAGYPKNMTHGYMAHMEYAYRLLSIYANRAKVVITSRIHVGLPAAAMGIPVIFVEKGNWLPGGKQSVGRVEGLLEVFHRVHLRAGQNWTFGSLMDTVPPNPGNHLADRYRASFWNRLKRSSSFYEDAARLFGMVPLQRLGKKNVRNDLHSTFHILWEDETYDSWHARRAVEHIFYFHPNARLYMHGTDPAGFQHQFLNIWLESGYDVKYHTFDPKDVATELVDAGASSYSTAVLSEEKHHPYLLTWKYGGVFVSPSTHLMKELPITLDSGVARDTFGRIALLIHGRHKSPDTLMQQSEATLKVSVLSANQTVVCMEDFKGAGYFDEEDIGVVVDLTAATSRTLIRTSPCYHVMDKTCIFCDEIYWEFP